MARKDGKGSTDREQGAGGLSLSRLLGRQVRLGRVVDMLRQPVPHSFKFWLWRTVPDLGGCCGGRRGSKQKNTIGRGVLYAATGYWAQRRWWSSLWVLERHFVQKAVSPWTIMPPSTADGAYSVGVEHLVSLDMTNLGKKSAIQSELQSNVQRHNCSPVHDQPLAGTLASFIIHHLTCLRDSTA